MARPASTRFSGHQTFSFRYGWLEKGVAFVKSGKTFAADDALVLLGVGKNMVDSIRYWCEVFGLVNEKGVTPFASSLLDPESGWDPYLEDDASLWLLHWRLCGQQQFSNAGTVLFGEVHKPELQRLEWLEILQKCDSLAGGRPTSPQTLARDMECYLKCYAPVRAAGKKRFLELTGACPFQTLHLLSCPGGERLHFTIGPKAGLSPEIIGYAIWDYLQWEGRKQARLAELLYDPHSPGLVFRLDEGSLVEAINALEQSHRWASVFNLSSSAGIDTVHCELADGNDLLNAYYKMTDA